MTNARAPFYPASRSPSKFSHRDHFPTCIILQRPPTFHVTFVAQPGVDGLKAFRALLKSALRRFGLRAIDVRELTDETQTRENSNGGKK